MLPMLCDAPGSCQGRGRKTNEVGGEYCTVDDECKSHKCSLQLLECI